MTAPDSPISQDRVQWDAVFTARVLSRTARVVAAIIAVAGITVAIVNNRSSGAVLRAADQIAMAGIALVLAVAVLVLTRPRLKVGPAGLAVRNLLDYRVIPWSQVVDFSFPPGRRWARIDLPADEYVPVVAVQSVDREHAVAAMETVWESMRRYQDPAGKG